MNNFESFKKLIEDKKLEEDVAKSLLFYDFEVFTDDWMVVLITPYINETKVIINDREELLNYFNNHRNFIWVGYNNTHYDQFILKVILFGKNPKEINDEIIVKDIKPWEYFRNNKLDYKAFNFYNYDLIKVGDGGLKNLESFMNNDIKESDVDFKINRKLTQEELNESIKYCTHDVEQTIEVFVRRIDSFEARLGLLKLFNFDYSYMNKTDAQLTATILDAKKPEQTRNDEFNITLLPNIKIEKYKEVLEWYKNPENRSYDKSLEIDVAGVKHIFAWGGIHGAIPKFHDKGYFLNMDVTSYYPSLMIEYNLLSRNVSELAKFKNIYNQRINFKKVGDKREKPLKIPLNATYGACKDKFSQLYDPLQANNVCVNGQLFLLDLIEKLEPLCKIIQSNTDGILIQILPATKSQYLKVIEVTQEWQQRTRMKLDFERFTEIYQKDVNNYIIVKEDGSYKSKGAYVKKLNDLDNDLPIINTAVKEYMIHNTPVESTIMNATNLKDFSKTVKLTSAYLYAEKGHYDENGEVIYEKLNNKFFRIFASTKSEEAGIYKSKEKDIKDKKTGVITKQLSHDKFANTPDRCFINNDDINSLACPEYLDRSWYIDLANKRLEQFGVKEVTPKEKKVRTKKISEKAEEKTIITKTNAIFTSEEIKQAIENNNSQNISQPIIETKNENKQVENINIDIKETIIDKEVLELLLKDNTTGKNIIWATDSYEGHNLTDEILYTDITGDNEGLIKPRRCKSKEEQQKRTKEKAEVFTPSWVCNIQNNYVDEQRWNGKNPFNEVDYENKTWKTNNEAISFVGTNKIWKDYINENVLEMTCGEAPYIVSRYDTVTGKYIETKNRIGLLDRKFRVLNEAYNGWKNKTYEEKKQNWINWAYKAIQHTYGYEWQGDSLLLARENILYSFIDYYKDLFNEEPALNILKNVAYFISWNIWQMDGLKFIVPMSDIKSNKTKSFKASLEDIAKDVIKLENGQTDVNGIYCKIKNWELEKDKNTIYFVQCVDLHKKQ